LRGSADDQHLSGTGYSVSHSIAERGLALTVIVEMADDIDRSVGTQPAPFALGDL
jgi:hypothetical protein